MFPFRLDSLVGPPIAVAHGGTLYCLSGLGACWPFIGAAHHRFQLALFILDDAGSMTPTLIGGCCGHVVWKRHGGLDSASVPCERRRMSRSLLTNLKKKKEKKAL